MRHAYLDALQSLPYFDFVPPSVLVALAEKLQVHVCVPGDYICRHGDVGLQLFVLLQGRARLVSPPLGRARTRHVYAYATDGQACGPVAFFLPRTQPASIQVGALMRRKSP